MYVSWMNSKQPVSGDDEYNNKCIALVSHQEEMKEIKFYQIIWEKFSFLVNLSVHI